MPSLDTKQQRDGRLQGPHGSMDGGKTASAPVESDLALIAAADPDKALGLAQGEPEGLSSADAAARLKRFGPNAVAREGRPSIIAELWGRAMNPLNALLLVLAVISYFLSDARSAIVIALMVVLSIGLGFIQEHRSNNAAAKLAAMIKTRVSVKRRCGHDHPPTPGTLPAEDFFEIPLDQLVPGDTVRLSAGDVIPGDLRLLTARDVFVNQSALTGESMPVEKRAERQESAAGDPFELSNICFQPHQLIMPPRLKAYSRPCGLTQPSRRRTSDRVWLCLG